MNGHHNIKDTITLNPDYSTTRLVLPKPDSCLLPNSLTGPQLHGGLRTRGYDKASFETAGKPLITVVTAVYNGAAYLEAAIKSVLHQSYDNVEYIIIDGGSTDRSLEILRQYESGIDYWLSERDSGIFDAFNKAIRLSKGDWIAFLGSDDVYTEGAIKQYVFEVVKPGRTVEYVSSRAELYDSRSKSVTRIIGSQWNWKISRKFMNVAHVGSLHNRKLFDRLGLYDTSFAIAGDYELLLRAQGSLQAGFLNAVTVRMRTGGLSNSNKLVFAETLLAKTKTAGRNKFLCVLENYLAEFKNQVRRGISWVRFRYSYWGHVS